MNMTFDYVVFDDVDVVVEFDYSPAEPMMVFPIEKAYPGMEERVELTAVKVKANPTQDDILSALSKEQKTDIELACYQHVRQLELQNVDD